VVKSHHHCSCDDSVHVLSVLAQQVEFIRGGVVGERSEQERVQYVRAGEGRGHTLEEGGYPFIYIPHPQIAIYFYNTEPIA